MWYEAAPIQFYIRTKAQLGKRAKVDDDEQSGTFFNSFSGQGNTKSITSKYSSVYFYNYCHILFQN